MSVFDDSTKSVTDGTQETTTFLEKVIKEKGDQWNDPEVLAKGYAHSQVRIKELEELAKKAEEQDYAKKLLERLESQAPSTEGKTDVKDSSAPKQENTTPKSEDLESLIEQSLAKREQERSVRQNVAEADKLLEDRFGANAKEQVQKASQSLGMSLDRLKAIAGESPTAFMALMGEPPRQETNQNTRNNVNTESFVNRASQDRNQSYYAKMRREDRKRYFSPETQIQLLKDREALGEKFYS